MFSPLFDQISKCVQLDHGCDTLLLWSIQYWLKKSPPGEVLIVLKKVPRTVLHKTIDLVGLYANIYHWSQIEKKEKGKKDGTHLR